MEKNLEKKDKLNLGSGQFSKKGFLNVDFEKTTNPDMLLNLDKIPYPFKDNRFSIITGDHVLEHLMDPFKVMKELHRIIQPGGKIIIRVPHFSRGFTHPDHKRGFDVSFPLYFNPKYKAFFVGTELKLKKMTLHWFAQPYMKREVLKGYQYIAGIFLGKIFDSMASISPYLCSRIWCYLVGGFEEIEYVFEK